MTNTLFDDYGPQNAPGTWVPFSVAASEVESARALAATGAEFDPDKFPESILFRIRPLTMTEEVEIEREGRPTKEAFRMRLKTTKGFRTRDAEAEVPIERKADLDRKIRRAVRCLVDVSGPIGIKTTEAAEAWAKALGSPVATGPLQLRGRLTDAAREKVVTFQETILDFVLTTLDALKVEASEALTEETKN